ncbi:MAG: phospholipase D family protein [Alphaproteobacteria bacterium]|nr:phospholipase D family protein [Alphaproteobacteria bacterium]
MKHPCWIIVLIAVSFGSGIIFKQHFPQPPYIYQESAESHPSWKVCFTPTSRCLPLILTAIKEAKESIQVQGYSITSPEIGGALRDAHRKGIKVIVIGDKAQKTAKYSQINSLLEVGIPVFIDDKPAIAHNKIIIVDDLTVLTGSYNWTRAAELRNAENLLIIRDKELVRQYADNFQKRLLKSKKHNLIVLKTSK